MASEPDPIDPTTNPAETNATTCPQVVGCVGAYETDEATYIRFSRRELASTYAGTPDDGFRSNYIV